jgi:hypothetical protein
MDGSATKSSFVQSCYTGPVLPKPALVFQPFPLCKAAGGLAALADGQLQVQELSPLSTLQSWSQSARPPAAATTSPANGMEPCKWQRQLMCQHVPRPHWSLSRSRGEDTMHVVESTRLHGPDQTLQIAPSSKQAALAFHDTTNASPGMTDGHGCVSQQIVLPRVSDNVQFDGFLHQSVTAELLERLCSTVHKAGHLTLSPDSSHGHPSRPIAHEPCAMKTNTQRQGKDLAAKSTHVLWSQCPSPDKKALLPALSYNSFSQHLESDSVSSVLTGEQHKLNNKQHQNTGRCLRQLRTHGESHEQDPGFYTARSFSDSFSPALESQVCEDSTTELYTKTPRNGTLDTLSLSKSTTANDFQAFIGFKGKNPSLPASEASISISDLTDVPRDVRVTKVEIALLLSSAITLGIGL